MANDIRVTKRIVYDRQTILDIRKNVPEDFVPLGIYKDIFQKVSVSLDNKDHRERKRRRGCRAGVLVKLLQSPDRPPIPSILLANVQSLRDQLDELYTRIPDYRRLWKCNVVCFTETWLNPDTDIQPQGFSVHRQDRTSPTTGQDNGGAVCIFINNNWCTEVETVSQSCSPVLEHLMIRCQPFYLHEEFSCVLLTVVYIPPDAPTARALEELHGVICKEGQYHPDALSIIVGNLTNCDLKCVLPEYYQHVTCPTKDHCYTTIKDAYKPLPRQNCITSERLPVLLIPTYKQTTRLAG